MIYCDYNSSAPLSENLRGVFFDLPFANPSAQHQAGKRSLKLINTTSRFIKEFFNSSDYNILYHSGATEGSNQCILTNLSIGDSFFYSDLDHSCIRSLVPILKEKGIHCIALKLDTSLDFLESNYELIEENLSNNGLLNFTWVHNETGRIWSLEILKELKNKFPHLLIHVDATQAIGKIENFRSIHTADFFTFSGHKFGALNGVGFTLHKNKLNPIIFGGKHQENQRSGTLNTQGVASLKYALENLKLNFDLDHLKLIKEKLCEFRSDLISKDMIIDFPQNTNTAYNTEFLVFKYLKTQILLPLLDLNGISVGSGSACTSGVFEENHLLNSLNLYDYSKNTIRISVAPDADLDLLEKTIDKTKELILSQI